MSIRLGFRSWQCSGVAGGGPYRGMVGCMLYYNCSSLHYQVFYNRKTACGPMIQSYTFSLIPDSYDLDISSFSGDEFSLPLHFGDRQKMYYSDDD